jgi:hypothetical protein
MRSPVVSMLSRGLRQSPTIAYPPFERDEVTCHHLGVCFLRIVLAVNDNDSLAVRPNCSIDSALTLYSCAVVYVVSVRCRHYAHRRWYEAALYAVLVVPFSQYTHVHVFASYVVVTDVRVHEA